MALLLVMTSTLLPTLSYAQRYADHISSYDVSHARSSAIKGFAQLYVSPQAALLPVVLATEGTASIDCLPSSSLFEKHFPSHAPDAPVPDVAFEDLFGSERHPVGLDPSAQLGPPRLLVG
ncbi:MAG: hypothetical protein KI785_01580 [Devosiaceae bacterium]|nr:hypothetical protein [Devosiaceae bacterium MH13]